MEKKFNYCIITDEKGKPMAWDYIGKQLAYCTDERWQDEHHPVKSYTVLRAKNLIRKSIEHREKGNRSEFKYKIMPFQPTLTIRQKQLISIR